MSIKNLLLLRVESSLMNFAMCKTVIKPATTTNPFNSNDIRSDTPAFPLSPTLQITGDLPESESLRPLMLAA